MILDTTFLVDVLRGDPAVETWEAELSESGAVAVTPVTVMELWEGVHRAETTETERERVGELLDGLAEAPFDTASAKRAGAVNASLADSGTPIDVEDVMIAAIALERDEAVLTRNGSHFGRVDGLTVETY